MSEATSTPVPGRRPGVVTMLVAAVIAAVVVLLVWRFWPWRGTVSTDDAFIDSRVVQIGPQASGRVMAVPVADNQHVEAGQVLIEIDPAPYQAKLDEARSALALAEATLSISDEFATMTRINTGTAVDQAKADLRASVATAARDRANATASNADAQREEADYQRILAVGSDISSAQQRETAEKTAEAAQARAVAAQANADASDAQVAVSKIKLETTTSGAHQAAAADAGVARARADVERAKAAVHEAEIVLAYTHITAPCAGTVTRKAVEVGATVQIGQSLLALVGDELWVVANLKEDQLAGIAIDAPVDIRVDAYPGVTFPAKVDSVQSGSGVRFSLLPAENATGNFVKVVQRVPVKLVFTDQPDRRQFHLGPGMSVEPTIRTR